MFPVASPPNISISPGPVICTAPPLPGVLPVTLFLNITLRTVTSVPAPELSSSPPPALDA